MAMTASTASDLIEPKALAGVARELAMELTSGLAGAPVGDGELPPQLGPLDAFRHTPAAADGSLAADAVPDHPRLRATQLAPITSRRTRAGKRRK